MGHIGSIIFHRHWRDLMERTGTSFDMNPESFTLENMFSIELHKYGGVIGDIVTSAVKELSIEKVPFLLPDDARGRPCLSTLERTLMDVWDAMMMLL